jgi:hypothetical protein
MPVMILFECMKDILGGLVREDVVPFDVPETIEEYNMDSNACIIEGDKVNCLCDGCLGGCRFAEDGPFDFICLHYEDNGECSSEKAKGDRVLNSIFGCKKAPKTIGSVRK